MPLRKPKTPPMLVDPETYVSPPLGPIDAGMTAEHHKVRDDHLAHRIRLGGHITYYNSEGVHVIETKDGVRPFEPGTPPPPQPDCAELKIRELAFMNRIRATRDEWDDWAEAVSNLAGDDIKVDEVEQLVINMGKAKVVDGIELTKLLARYLEERDG